MKSHKEGFYLSDTMNWVILGWNVRDVINGWPHTGQWCFKCPPLLMICYFRKTFRAMVLGLFPTRTKSTSGNTQLPMVSSPTTRSVCCSRNPDPSGQFSGTTSRRFLTWQTLPPGWASTMRSLCRPRRSLRWKKRWLEFWFGPWTRTILRGFVVNKSFPCSDQFIRQLSTTSSQWPQV